jgi:Tol biopolymer transport system component/predicted Ser/Thr protein kinase
MAVAAGAKLGPYEILALIGAGGMGEVYKARDTRLDRTVAIKVSLEKFSERFEREARAIAALSHPHICQLYDVGSNYLVMEYIDGAPLKGPLALQQAMKYGGQICDALDAAHIKGITHRDLKPANILVTKAGVKLLDFGLARIAASPDETMTMAVMGTPAYMAPEQWDGKPGDARSDIYAFGCVLYEMLTGKRAAPQERAAVEPAALEQVLSSCLAKDPDERWQSAHDVKRALELVGPASNVCTPAKGRSYWAAWGIAAISVVIALFFALRPGGAPPAAEVIRLSVDPPENALLSGQSITAAVVPQFALSPDGKSIVFVATALGARPALWLRSLQAGTAQMMSGTDDADLPFWSPESRWIAFFADGKLKKIPAGGGTAETIADAEDFLGGAWGPDDTILFGTFLRGIQRVSSSGGTLRSVTKRDDSRKEGSHRFPEFLPDGRHFLFQVRSGLTEQAGVYAGSLDGKTKKLLIRGNTNALYSPSGHMLFMNGDTLMAQPFDAEHLELRGQPSVVEGHIGLSSVGNGAVSVSGAGILAHARTLSEMGQLTWFGRSGNPSGALGPSGDYLDFRLSPDQTRLAASTHDLRTGVPDIWLTDLALGNPAPLTFGPYYNISPVWSADGARIIFRANPNGGGAEIYSKSAGGGGRTEPLLLEQAARAYGGKYFTLIPWDCSPDGRYLLYSTLGTDSDLWLLPLVGDAKPAKFLSAPGDQWHGNFSPDGKLVAYSSNESGRVEVRVQTFPLSDRQWIVSTAGGYEPRWRADGREIYYLSLDRKLMAATVGPGPAFGAPRRLFQTRVPGGVYPNRTHYVPSRDGQRFLINTLAADLRPVSITVVLNWAAGLKK